MIGMTILATYTPKDGSIIPEEMRPYIGQRVSLTWADHDKWRPGFLPTAIVNARDLSGLITVRGPDKIEKGSEMEVGSQHATLAGDCFKRLNDDGGWLYMQLLGIQEGLMMQRSFLYVPYEGRRRRVLIEDGYFEDQEGRRFTKISRDELQQAWEGLMNVVMRDLAPKAADV